MNKLCLLFLGLFIFQTSKAQFIKDRAVEISIGYGLTAPYDDVDVSGSGFYAQGEYVLTAYSWLDFRPYAGFIFTGESSNQSLPEQFKSTSNAFLFGGKLRLTAPIPYFAPYIEVGLGGSLGKFETITPFTNLSQSGLLFHIPFSLGLELGKDKRINLELTYYFHNSVEQFSGAFALGFTIPLNSSVSD
jgi:hypothetical protein